MRENIKKAVELLQPINYKTFDTGYFVLKNGSDMGNSDFCENCIDEAVKEARKSHKQQRQKILDKFKQIAETGYFKIGKKKIKVKGKYTEKEIAKAKRYELKEYPVKASFTYKGHDPDFSGGLTAPHTCEGCYEAFTCSFTPDNEEARHLLKIVNKREDLSDSDKWELDIALYNYDYTTNDVKLLLNKVIKKLHHKIDNPELITL